MVRSHAGGKHAYCESCRAFAPRQKVLERIHKHRRPAPILELSLVYEPSGSDHNDLVLRLGPWTRRVDTYYFALDRSGSVAEVLGGLLRQWSEFVQGLVPGGLTHLVYDFSDQYSGWLRVSFDGEELWIEPGWSKLEGYAFYPSDTGQQARELADFEADPEFGEPLKVSKRRFDRCIQECLALLD